MKKFRSLLLGSLVLFLACADEIYVPKPRVYPRVILPQGEMQTFHGDECPFHFEHPEYTQLQFEPKLPRDAEQRTCWFDMIYPELSCTVHFSYYQIDRANPLNKLREDAYRLTNEHNRKATFIEELSVNNPNGTYGTIFNLEGPVATPFQFYLTDSSSHFLRGALYFKTRIEPDSLMPYYEFVKQDLAHLINTFSWEEKAD